MSITFYPETVSYEVVPNPYFEEDQPEDIYNPRTIEDAIEPTENFSNSNAIRLLDIMGVPRDYCGSISGRELSDAFIKLKDFINSSDEVELIMRPIRLMRVVKYCVSENVPMIWS